jgi:hypothetical protein
MKLSTGAILLFLGLLLTDGLDWLCEYHPATNVPGWVSHIHDAGNLLFGGLAGIILGLAVARSKAQIV